MTPQQFELIMAARFGRLNEATTAACRAVIIDGITAYKAEQAEDVPRGTVSRYVNRIHAELAFCEEVASHA